MKMNKSIVCVFVFSLLIFAGCQVVGNLWPTPISKQALRYAGYEPNAVAFYEKNIGFAEEVKQTALEHYIETEQELLYKSNLNKEKYQLAVKYLDLSIQTAKTERETMIGTLQNPGWLLSSLIALLPVGTYVAGYKTQRPEDYTEAEMKTLLNEAKSTTQS